MNELEFYSGPYAFYCHKSSWIAQIVEEKKFPSLDILHSSFDQYIIAFYWSTVTLLCTGYGDIHAYSPVEMFMSTLVQIVGTIFYSAILGDISATIQTSDSHRGQYKSRISDVVKFFKVYSVPEEAQMQVSSVYNISH